MVIGHDPRLRESDAQAEKAFYFEYLERYSEPPKDGPGKSKYGLAHKVWEYVSALAGRQVLLEELYVTNLCNEFLESTQGKGTVRIPDEVAERGVLAIRQAVEAGHFQVILPMSVQVFYHLCRVGFVDETDERVQVFLQKAAPRDKDVYDPKGKAAFLQVCGQRFHHRGILLIPILHVKPWSNPNLSELYREPMAMAAREVQAALAEQAYS